MKRKTTRPTVRSTKKQADGFADQAKTFLKSSTAIEIALVGAAGYFLWKNRDRIQSFLESKGIDISSMVSEKVGHFLEPKSSESRLTQ